MTQITAQTILTNVLLDEGFTQLAKDAKQGKATYHHILTGIKKFYTHDERKLVLINKLIAIADTHQL